MNTLMPARRGLGCGPAANRIKRRRRSSCRRPLPGRRVQRPAPQSIDWLGHAPKPAAGTKKTHCGRPDREHTHAGPGFSSAPNGGSVDQLELLPRCRRVTLGLAAAWCSDALRQELLMEQISWLEHAGVSPAGPQRRSTEQPECLVQYDSATVIFLA